MIDAPALFVKHLFDLASVWTVVRELLILSKQCLASRSSRLAPTFVRDDSVFLSSKAYIFTCVISVLVHFPFLMKLAWLCTGLNIIGNAAFFFVTIVT